MHELELFGLRVALVVCRVDSEVARPMRSPATCCVWAQSASVNALARSATWRTAVSQSTAARGRVHTADRGGAQRCATLPENVDRAHRHHVPVCNSGSFASRYWW
jgi:hypothetical protein